MLGRRRELVRISRSPAGVEHCAVGRLVRVPASRDQVFHSLRPRWHGDHCHDFRLLVLAMAWAWGRRHVTHWSRDLDAQHPRTRFHTCFLGQRWDPEAALRPKAGELLRTWLPQAGETRSPIIDDSKQTKRGPSLDAVRQMKAPPIDAYIRGHQSVCGILVCRDSVLRYGSRRDVQQADCAALACPFR